MSQLSADEWNCIIEGEDMPLKNGRYTAERTRKDDDVQNNDPVNHPQHYCQGGIECIDVIHAALGDDGMSGFLHGNAIKYLFRAEHKGNAVQDLEKARWYIDRLIASACRK